MEDIEQYLAEQNRLWDEIKMADAAAKASGTLLGRYITHSYADGQAVYIVAKENKRTVRLICRDDIGDGWVLPAWGYDVSVPKTKASEMISRRDAFERIWNKGAGNVEVKTP